MVSAVQSKRQLDFGSRGSVIESCVPPKSFTREKYLSHLGSDGPEGNKSIRQCLGILPSGTHQCLVRTDLVEKRMITSRLVQPMCMEERG